MHTCDKPLDHLAGQEFEAGMLRDLMKFNAHRYCKFGILDAILGRFL
jgi:hypothetical protein